MITEFFALLCFAQKKKNVVGIQTSQKHPLNVFTFNESSLNKTDDDQMSAEKSAQFKQHVCFYYKETALSQ